MATGWPSAVEIVSWTFFATNAARFLAYLPQLRSAWNCANGAASVNRLTWGYFSVAHLSGMMYSMVVTVDVGMALVFLGNFAACFGLVVVITWKRRDHSRSRRGGFLPRTHEVVATTSRHHQPLATPRSLCFCLRGSPENCTRSGPRR